MAIIGGLATRTGFSAAEIEQMDLQQLSFWARCLNLFDAERKDSED